MAKGQTVFFCQSCGFESTKWMGQCPACREWNTFAEEPVERPKAKVSPGRVQSAQPVKLEDIEATGNFLLDIMPILFIPASVGLIESYDEMKAILVPLIVTCLISTLVVMGVTGKVTELMVAVLKKKDAKGAGEEKTV